MFRSICLPLIFVCALGLAAQNGQTPAPPTSQQKVATPPAANAPAQTQAPQTQTPAPAGGPGGGGGPIVIPKQSTPAPTTPAPAPPPPPPQQKPQYSMQVTVPEVEIPVTVQTQDGQFVPRLGAAQFALTEDGVPQKIDKVSVTSDAPLTCVLLVEFRNTWAAFLYQILEASYAFTGQLQPQDWVALVSYDLKPTIVVDFTHDRNAIVQGLNSMRFPDFSEADLFDSLSDTLDRLDGVKGHKIVVLISTGLNTFSRMTWDETRKHLAETQGVTVYTVSMGWTVRTYMESTGMMGSIADLDFLQGDNELRYIAQTTGGRFYQPRFEGEYNDVFSDIAASVRNQYILSYVPTNKKLDGTYRKVKVSLVGPSGQPLKIVDQKGKQLKYDVTYRDGYWAKHVVE